MSFLLLLKDGVPQIKFPVGSTCAIGRSSNCEIQVPDLRISRRHALIYIEGSDHYIKDLESENGTYLNGERLGKLARLQKGDEVTIGEQVFIFNPPVDILHSRVDDKSLLIIREEFTPKYKTASLVNDQNRAQDIRQIDSESYRSIYPLICDVASVLDLDLFLNKLVENLISHFSADRGYILGYHSGTGKLSPLAIRSEINNAALSHTLLKRAAEKKEPLLIDDALEGISFDGGKSIIKHQLRSVMISPLIVNNAVIGFIQLDKNKKNAFDSSILSRLYLISGIAATALKNAQTIDRERKKKPLLYR